MVAQASQIIFQLVEIEKNVGKLYRIFGTIHKVDSLFWNQLAVEEDRHALLLSTHAEYITESPALHRHILATSVETLYRINSKIEGILQLCGKQSPTRIDCFTIALQIEQSAGEVHLQNVHESPDDNIAVQVLQSLSSADSDHADRIKRYMEYRLRPDLDSLPAH
jgi:hypothetical protein